MIAILAIVSAIVPAQAKADQIVFSQYDGISTWTNIYVNVPDARAFIEPGVAYTAATGGKAFSAASRIVTVDTFNLISVFRNTNIPSAPAIEQLRISNGLEGVEGTVTDVSKMQIDKEEPHVAKATVIVPADADLRFFGIYFFDDRITYLQLMDNYQNMHPLVPFKG